MVSVWRVCGEYVMSVYVVSWGMCECLFMYVVSVWGECVGLVCVVSVCS